MSKSTVCLAISSDKFQGSPPIPLLVALFPTLLYLYVDLNHLSLYVTQLSLSSINTNLPLL